MALQATERVVKETAVKVAQQRSGFAPEGSGPLADHYEGRVGAPRVLGQPQ